MTVLLITSIVHSRWKAFLNNHPNGNIFQSPEIFEVYKKTKNYEPIAIGAIDESDNLIGVFLAVIQKEHNGIVGKLSSRSIIMGGPLVKDNDPEILNFLLKEYNDKIKGKAIYTQIRNLFDQSWAKEIFEKNGFKYEPHLDILIDLKQSSDILWKNLDSRARNKIRKAEKGEIDFKVLEPTPEITKLSYKILQEVYKNAKLPLASNSLFENIFEILGSNNMIKIFCAIKNDIIIGIRIGLVYKDTIYDWYAGSLRSFYKYNPNDFLPYNILVWGHNNNYKIFDFGGAGKPNIPYGVRDHKMKFGGELVEFGRFEKIHSGVLFQIGKIGLAVYRKMK